MNFSYKQRALLFALNNKLRNPIFVSIYAAFLVLLFSLLLLNMQGIDVSSFSNNMRYAFSAAAQVIATIVTILIVIFTIISSRIPNYEPIFKQHYQIILKKYYEIQKTKKLITLAGVTIIFLIIFLFFIIPNTGFLVSLVAFATFLIVLSLLELISFFSNALVKSNKYKLFRDIVWCINNLFDYEICFFIVIQIKELATEENKPFQKFLEDKHLFLPLLNPCILKLFKELPKKERMGDVHYYGIFHQLLNIIEEKKLEEEIYPRTYFELQENFLKYMDGCIHILNGHCQKYIDEVLYIILHFIRFFTRTHNFNATDIYFELCVKMGKLFLLPKFKHQFDSFLFSLSKFIGENGMNTCDLFVKLLGALNYSSKERIMFLQNVLDSFSKQRQLDEEFPLKKRNASEISFDDFCKKEVEDEIKKLKSFSDNSQST